MQQPPRRHPAREDQKDQGDRGKAERTTQGKFHVINSNGWRAPAIAGAVSRSFHMFIETYGKNPGMHRANLLAPLEFAVARDTGVPTAGALR